MANYIVDRGTHRFWKTFVVQRTGISTIFYNVLQEGFNRIVGLDAIDGELSLTTPCCLKSRSTRSEVLLEFLLHGKIGGFVTERPIESNSSFIEAKNVKSNSLESAFFGVRFNSEHG